MPLPAIGDRKDIYYRYLQYSKYSRLRYSKHLKNWLTVESRKFSATGGGTSIRFGADLAISGSEVFNTQAAHGLTAGDGPFVVVKNNTGVQASLTLTVVTQPSSSGDWIGGDGAATGLFAFFFIAAGGTPSATQIALGTTTALTAANIRTKLNGVNGITVTGTGTSITVTATQSGSDGNGIEINASDHTKITGGGALIGGQDPTITAPLQEETFYYIYSTPDTDDFLLTLHRSGGDPIRPTAAGTDLDSLVVATSQVAIYDLLRFFTPIEIESESDITNFDI